MAETQGRETSLRRLRESLKRMREERSLQQVDVADKLDWSSSKLIRIENGSVGISVTDLRALTGIYQAPEEAVERLVELVRQTKGRPWWSTYNISPAYKKFIGFEADASRMWQYHLSIVPGLLQTDAYMRALIPALRIEPTAQPALNDLAEVRLRRQQEIIQAVDGPDITILIDEMALRRPVGGGKAMVDQLKHIQRVGESKRIDIAVLPFSAGPHFGMQGGFSVMEFADDIDNDILVQENATGNILLQDEPELTAKYHGQFDVMLGMSLQGDRAAEFLDSVAKDFG
jgi:transcriptional regulator with XRE-family HTH domain